MPAPQMRAPNPFRRASRANAATCAGVRCALMTCSSTATPNSVSVSTAPAIFGLSLAEPISTPTFVITWCSLHFSCVSCACLRGDVVPPVRTVEVDLIDGGVGLVPCISQRRARAHDREDASPGGDQIVAPTSGPGVIHPLAPDAGD